MSDAHNFGLPCDLYNCVWLLSYATGVSRSFYCHSHPQNAPKPFGGQALRSPRPPSCLQEVGLRRKERRGGEKGWEEGGRKGERMDTTVYETWLCPYSTIYTVVQKTGPLTLCHIALSLHNVFSRKSAKCLRKLGHVYSNLSRVLPAADVRTLLCNVDVKITLLRTVHVTQLKR